MAEDISLDDVAANFFRSFGGDLGAHLDHLRQLFLLLKEYQNAIAPTSETEDNVVMKELLNSVLSDERIVIPPGKKIIAIINIIQNTGAVANLKEVKATDTYTTIGS